MSERMTPAARVIQKCGGIQATARIVGLHRTSVNRWMLPKESGGTGGLVPSDHAQSLLVKAPAHGISLSPTDFFDLEARA